MRILPCIAVLPIQGIFLLLSLNCCAALPAAIQSEETRKPYTIAVRVQDVNGAGIESAKLTPQYPLATKLLPRGVSFATDANGDAVVHIDPDSGQLLQLICEKHGYVSYIIERNGSFSPGERELGIRIVLDRGISVSGRIVDDAGNPVVGANIHIRQRAQDVGDSRFSTTEFEYGATISDEQGHWKIEAIATNDWHFPVLVADHPDFAGPAEYRVAAIPNQLVLPRGEIISGRVVDGKGDPVAGAVVRFTNHAWGQRIPTALTDASGNYSVRGVVPGTAALTVQSPGFAPATRTTIVEEHGISQADFTLLPGKRLAGRVVDPDGKGIPFAFVRVCGWNGQNVLHWSDCTDENGDFVWTEAPIDHVDLFVAAKGYLMDTATGIMPDDSPVVIPLKREIRISGSITDETGNPLENVPIFLYRIADDGTRIEVKSTNPKAGRYEFLLSRMPERVLLTVHRHGLGFIDIAWISRNDGDVTHNIVMESSESREEIDWQLIHEKIEKGEFGMDSVPALEELRRLGASLEYWGEDQPVFRVTLTGGWEIDKGRGNVPNVKWNESKKKWNGEIDSLRLLKELPRIELFIDGMELDSELVEAIGDIETAETVHLTGVWRIEPEQFKCLENLIHVKAFHIDNRWQTFPREGIEALSRLPTLESLTFSGSNHLTYESFSGLLRQFPAIRQLTLSDSEIDARIAEELVLLESLESLEILSNLDDDFIRVLGNRPKLRHLAMRGRGITDDGLAAVVSQFPNLTSLRIVRSSITGRGIRLLAQRRIPNLTTLQLDGGPRPPYVEFQLSHPECRVYQVHFFPDGSVTSTLLLKDSEYFPDR